MSEQNLKSRLLASSVFAGAALVAVAALPAHAQEDEVIEVAADAADEEAVQERITVTGTRIGSANYQAISPVTSVGAEAIELSATLNVETLLNELPQVIPGNTVTSNNAGGEDFATIDLRGLGPSRSLVLIDGERVPAASTTGVVDLNTIPAGLIERVEVVTGGASAVYGSDAIAGVVNFILKDDYEGAQVTVRKGGSFEGLGGNETVDFLMGGNFDGGRGNITTYGSYSHRDGVLQSEFDYSAVAGALIGGYDYNTSQYTGIILVDTLDEYLAARDTLGGGANQVAFTLAPGGSATPPWGSISNSASNPFGGLATNPGTPNFASVDHDCNPATAPIPVNASGLSFNDAGQLMPALTGGACTLPIRANGSSRYNYAPDNYILLPSERFGIQTFANYELTEKVDMKVMLSYVRSKTQVQLAATPITGLSIPVSSPAIAGADGIVGTADDPHPDLSAALNSRPTADANFTMAWRSKAVGNREGDFTNSSLLGRVSFDGELTDTWDWNLSLGWGQVDFNSQLRNNVNRVALLQGIQGCANVAPTAVLPSCVDVDIFGEASLTPAMAGFIRTNLQTAAQLEQSSVSGFVRGPLFELPAGPVEAVFGLEYRDDEVSFVVDDAQRRGEIAGFNAQNSIFGNIDVYEAYTEVVVPLVSEQPFAYDLSVEAGYRTSDYSTIGSVESYKYGANYAPVDWFRVRAIYNKAVRAPSALESFQAGDQGFPSYIDPCATNDATLQAFCSNPASIGGGFVPTANYPGFAAANSQVQAFSFGNPNLEPEEGETLTAGIVFEPDFLPIGELRGSVDYFNIKLANAIVSRGATTILNSCYSNLGSTAQSQQDCQQIVRDPATGQITSVNTSLTNGAGEIELQGYDIQLDYNFDLDEVFAGAPGNLSLDTIVTLTDKYDFFGTRIEGTTEAGISGAIPDYKINSTLEYRLDDWTFQLQHSYVPSLMQDYPGGTFEGLGAPDTPELSNLDAAVAWNVSDRLRIVGNVSNVFDDLPPQTATGFFDQGNTDAALYAPWVIGRTYSISARLKF